MKAPSFLLSAGIAAATAACGSDSSSGPGPGGNATLECEERGYPCALSQVPITVLERGDALGDEALAMLEGGASTAEAAAFLEAQGDVAEVEWDDLAIWFRPEGGAGIWILREAAFSRPSPADIAPDARGRAPPRPAFHIVGPGSPQKKGLVLSPFLWHFEDSDEGPAIAAILSAARGYENRVTFQGNQQQNASTVGLGSFMGWDQYQVIHVSTHGKRICTAEGCRATISAGTLESALPAGPGTKAEKLHTLAHQGVTYAKGEKTGIEYLALTADFFRYQYPSGLDNSFVFLNACQSFGPQATDVVDAIQGNTSVVLGWTESVFSDEAAAVAAALYRSLAEGGYPAKVAYEQLGDSRTGQPVPGSNSPQLRLSERPAGGDLRIRDVVYLLRPGSDQILTASDLVAIDGTQGDGAPDAVPFLVRVDGVKPELAGGMMVYVSIDGVEADPVALTSGQADDEDRWLVGGTMPLGYDLQDETPVTFRAWVNLHSGGESRHETGATLSGTEPIMGTVWDFEAVHTSGWTGGIPGTPYTATARLTLRFAPGQSPGELHPRYVVTGGTVTYDYNHTYYDCTYSAPVITFDVTADVSLDSRLVFDATVAPVRYSGVIYTQGPEIEVFESCGSGGSTRTQRAANTWLLANPPEGRTVSADRRSIAGTYRVESGNGFVVESQYTISRSE